jgi:hypothetical protein
MRNLIELYHTFDQAVINEAAKRSDIALDEKYGYGLSTDENSFGWKANCMSATYGLHAIMSNVGISNERALLEIVADAVHDGWSSAAYNVDDPRYQDQPQKRVNRIALADTPYHALSEGEKEKDRVIARCLIDFAWKEGPLSNKNF